MNGLLQSGISRESAAEFRSRMRSQFDKQLETYVKTFENTLRTRSFYGDEDMRKDATWTALFQFGKARRTARGQHSGIP
jgi:hypothetical protein